MKTKTNLDMASPRRRILCVTSNYPRWQGDSTTPFVHHLAQDLVALGWEVDVLAPHAPNAARHENLDGVTVERFRYLWPQALETICYQGGALMNLKQNKLNYIKLPALIFFQWLSIFRRLLTGRYDIVHSHWILPQGFTAALACAPLRLPHVITVHGSDAFALKGPLLGAFKRFSVMNADKVTVNSTATKVRVNAIAPRLSGIRLIPMGITATTADPLRTAQLRALHTDGPGPLLIFVGRLVSLKGVDDLLQAMPLMLETLKDTRLLILGEGPLRGELQQLSHKLGIAKRVNFIGWVEQSDVVNYLSAADIFVGPSKQSADGATEAQGLTFMEAMHAGTPVIATSVGGITDTVKHEETGLLIPESSPADIAASVLRLTKDKRLRDAIVRQGKRVIKQCGRSASAEKFSKLFDEKINKRA